MASRWSTRKLIAEHKDIQANCLAVSVDGRCALSSRRSISLINCNKPDVIALRIKRETKWDSTATEFNKLDSNLLAITNAHTVQIYNIEANVRSGPAVDPTKSLTNGINSQLVTLRGHTRTVTDLNWSYTDVSALATASYDNNMYIWDIRDYRKPILSMSSVAGATQVKWSKLDENILATSHEGDVRVWDRRRSNTPINYITAHSAKINGLDWSPNIASQLATCSQDGSVRFFDLTNSKGKADFTLTTGLPVWRARFTPFGNGLITALVPQLRRTGENNSLWMWSMDTFEQSAVQQPLHTFVGHSDVVLDFGWYNKTNNEYELITWSKDNSLRIWEVDSQLLTLHSNDNNIVHSYPDFAIDELNDNQSSTESTEGTDSSAVQRPNTLELNQNEVKPSPEPAKSVHSSHDSDVKKPQTPETPVNNVIPNLSQEFSLINVSIPNMQIEELNAAKRVCIITATTSISCRLKMSFPTGYPNHVAPRFELSFVNGTNASRSEDVKKELLKVLQTTAYQQVKRNRTCLEPCLRQFMDSLKKMTGSSTTSLVTEPTFMDRLPSHHYDSYLDGSVPFPRTSGARFCSGELLVCFGRPPHLEQMNAPTEFTPRSLSALSAYLSTHYRTSPSQHFSAPIPSISSFYLDSSKRKRYKTKSKRNQLNGKASASPKHKSNNCGPVFVYSVAGLLPISRHLAENYVLTTNGDIVSMCETNAKVARTFGRRDLCQTWHLVKLSAEIYLKGLNNTNLMDTPWPLHPFGKKMIQSLIDHSVFKCNDIQTAAMLSATFHLTDLKAKMPHKSSQSSSGNNSTLVNELKSNRFFPPKPGNSPYHTVGSTIPAPNTPETYGDWNLISAVESLKRTRSNSWSDFAENEALLTGLSTKNGDSFCEQLELEAHETNLKMLDIKLQHQYDSYKQIYADILYRWQLMDKRALVLKSCSTVNQNSLVHVGIDFVTECNNEYCEKRYNTCRSAHCQYCKRPTLLCAICRMPVRGAVNHCVVCGHGGHTVHMYNWFAQSDQCPTGCGCLCLQQSINIFG